MLVMKVLAARFAILVLAKIIMLVVARDYWLGLVDKMYGPGNRTLMFCGVAWAVVGILVMLHLSIIEVGAVMLWTSLLMGLGMIPYGEMVLKWRNEIALVGLGKDWWVMALWAALAVWILAAVLGKVGGISPVGARYIVPQRRMVSRGGGTNGSGRPGCSAL